ncbi:MAG: hypothetical protein RR311_12050 [Comamonas sp.]
MTRKQRHTPCGQRKNGAANAIAGPAPRQAQTRLQLSKFVISGAACDEFFCLCNNRRAALSRVFTNVACSTFQNWKRLKTDLDAAAGLTACCQISPRITHPTVGNDISCALDSPQLLI